MGGARFSLLDCTVNILLDGVMLVGGSDQVILKVPRCPAAFHSPSNILDTEFGYSAADYLIHQFTERVSGHVHRDITN